MRRWLIDGEGRLRIGWRLLVYLVLFAVCGAAASILGHALAGQSSLDGCWDSRSRSSVEARSSLEPGCSGTGWITDPGHGWGSPAPGARHARWPCGFAVGVLMLGALFCVEWRLGWIDPSWVGEAGKLSAVVGALLAALGIGVMEELLLRGVFLQNLGERLPLWVATLGTGVVFGLLHLANPAQRVDVAFVVSAALATLMLVLARFVTGTLGWAIGWHAAWDWMQDVLGIADLGAWKAHQLVSVVQHGPVAWTGQAPSIEGGGLAIAIIRLAAAALWLVSRRHGLAIAWREPLDAGEPRSSARGKPWRALERCRAVAECRHRAGCRVGGDGCSCGHHAGRGDVPSSEPPSVRHAMRRSIATFALCMIPFGSLAAAEEPAALAIPPDSPRWELEGQAKVIEHQGRKAIFLDGGAAAVKGLEMRDGVIDVDVSTPASRGFFGIQFRIADDGANAEWVYLRQHKSGQPDAMQYTPVLNTGLNWQLYNGPGFTGAVDIPRTSGSTCAWRWRGRRPGCS